MKLKKKKYAVGAVVGSLMGIGDAIGTPIRQRSEQIDPRTGEFINQNKAVNSAVAGSFFAPWKAATDPYANTGEKIAGALGWGWLHQGNIKRRQQEANKNAAFLAQHPNTIGESYNPYYMAQGGDILDNLIPAELEDGEVFKTPDGKLEEVKGKSHAQGGEMFMMPQGTQILGKNISSEYGERFKDMGQRLKTMQDKHEKIMDSHQPMIAKSTSKRMLDKIKTEFDGLMKEQEQAKILEDTIGVYARGGSIYIKPSHRGRFTNWAKKHNMSVSQAASKVMANKDKYSSAVVKMANFAKNAKGWKHPDGGLLGEYKPKLLTEGQLSTPSNMFYGMPMNQGPVTSTPTSITEKFRATDWGQLGNVAQGVSEFAPIAYNVGQGLTKEPQFNYQQYTNPYIGDIRSALRNRRYNINPELESNKIAQAVYNRNLRQGGASPSQLQGGLQAGMVSRMRSDATARATQQNMNNQYLGQQADMDYNLGRDVSGLKLTGYDINQKNKAVQRNFMGTAMSQLQQLGQVKRLEKNQIYRDAQRMGLLKDLFSDFSYTDEGWIFNKDGTSMSDSEVMNYLKGKKNG